MSTNTKAGVPSSPTGATGAAWRTCATTRGPSSVGIANAGAATAHASTAAANTASKDFMTTSERRQRWCPPTEGPRATAEAATPEDHLVTCGLWSGSKAKLGRVPAGVHTPFGILRPPTAGGTLIRDASARQPR